MNLDEVIKGRPGQGIPKAMYIFNLPAKKLGLGGEEKNIVRMITCGQKS